MCDTFVALENFTASGAILFAKNSDRLFNEAQYLECLPAKHYPQSERLRLTHIEINQVSDTHAVLLSKPHWIWGAEMGANQHGLVIGNEAVFNNIPAPKEDGIIGMDLLRLGLERACNVDEAIEVITGLLMEYGQSGNCSYGATPATYDNAFIIADSQGAQVLETAGREWVTRQLDNHYALSNALTIDANYSRSSPTLESTAEAHGCRNGASGVNFKETFEDKTLAIGGEQRRRHAMALLATNAGKMNTLDAFNILRSHGAPADLSGSVSSALCMHSRQAENVLGQTTGSMVSSLQDNKCVHWLTATATPCTSVFKPVILEAGLPAHGPTPGADEKETASLWWRHEKLSHFLLHQTDGKNLFPSFVSERDALETAFVNKMEQCPAPTNMENLRICEKAVADCWQKAIDFENKWYALCL